MRTIKFRGKCAYSGKWCFGSLAFYAGDEEDTEIHGIDIYREGSELWQKNHVRSDTVGQFTGLCDADGKEIYEGDIFQVKAYEPKYEVYFANGVYEYRQIGSPNRPFPLRRINFDSYVIGNVYDNPEFLEG